MQKILFSALCTFALFTHAHALTLNAKKGKVVAQPIAIVPFLNNKSADKIDFIVSADLQQSGVFAPVDPNTYSQRPISPKSINFDDWTNKNIPYVVVGQLKGAKIEFAIADTFRKKIIGTYSVTTDPNNRRLGAHKVADAILRQLTGVRGAFATRLTYIHESGSGKNRRYRLMVSDSDGKNAKTLLSSKKPIVSPRFSPNGRQIAYVTYEGRIPEIVTHDVFTGRRSPVSAAEGINSSPAWSSDGNKIAMVLSKDGNPEIYIKDLRSGSLTRVTNNPAIDTEPVWSPKGGSMYFTSDRAGSPQLYKINLSTGRVGKVSYSGSENAGADVSPDGKKLAIATNRNGRYRIGTLNVANGKFTAVSSGVLDETPRFSPNGQMLIYTTLQGGRQVLKIVNVDGTGENVLSSSSQIRDPDWSSYLD